MFMELLKESEISDDLRMEIFQDIWEQAESFIKMMVKDKDFVIEYANDTNNISKDTAYDYLEEQLSGYLDANTAKDYISKCKCWKQLMKNKDWEDVVYDIIEEIQYDHAYEIIEGYDNDLYKKAKKIR